MSDEQAGNMPDPTGKQSGKKLPSALERAKIAARVAYDNRGRDIVILDMRKMTDLFDYFVIATGTSRRQMHAMSEEIDRALEQDVGDRRLGVEGYQESRWILLDYGDVVVHLFAPEVRDFYALEELWANAERVPTGLPETPLEQSTPTEAEEDFEEWEDDWDEEAEAESFDFDDDDVPSLPEDDFDDDLSPDESDD
ncbi:hypothetical protein JCM19992_31740 [Thermostilla marina]